MIIRLGAEYRMMDCLDGRITLLGYMVYTDCRHWLLAWLRELREGNS